MTTKTAAPKAKTNGHDPKKVSPDFAPALPFDAMYIDGEYNRGVTWVAREIEVNFDPHLVLTLVVNRRPRRKDYALVDGQNRMVGMQARGMTEAPCLVYDGLTRQEEAELFYKLSKNRKPQTPYQQFRSRLVMRDKGALDILRIVESTGLALEHRGDDSQLVVKAVRALERIYDGRLVGNSVLPGPELLAVSLETVSAAWPDEPDALQSQIIQGCARVYARNESVDTSRFIRELAKASAWEITSSARTLGQGRVSASGSDIVRHVAQVMTGLYNTGLRGGRLPA